MGGHQRLLTDHCPPDHPGSWGGGRHEAVSCHGWVLGWYKLPTPTTETAGSQTTWLCAQSPPEHTALGSPVAWLPGSLRPSVFPWDKGHRADTVSSLTWLSVQQTKYKVDHNSLPANLPASPSHRGHTQDRAETWQQRASTWRASRIFFSFAEKAH